MERFLARNLKKRYGVSLLTALLSGCDYYDTRLVIYNNSPASITTWFSSSASAEHPSVNHTAFYRGREIKPGERFTMTAPGKEAWTHCIETSTNRRLNLIIYRFSELSRFENVDSLIANHRYTVKSVSLQELERSHWKVTVNEIPAPASEAGH